MIRACWAVFFRAEGKERSCRVPPARARTSHKPTHTAHTHTQDTGIQIYSQASIYTATQQSHTVQRGTVQAQAGKAQLVEKGRKEQQQQNSNSNFFQTTQNKKERKKKLHSAPSLSLSSSKNHPPTGSFFMRSL